MDKELMEFEANFSVLDRYGTYVTKEDYITDPAIGRDQQIKELILILLTPEKSAILIGKPGIGKTAIVEGLAYRIQQNDVPEALKGYEIINIKTASLLGTMPSGESKVQKMIDELKTKEKLILFIDEVHMLIGATDSSSLDFANIFKEGLGRGSIKVIGATTTEEYERYILRDKAFTRRFQKIEVPEPSREETIKIMMGTLPKFEKQTGRKMKYTSFIQERIMSFLVDITSEYKRVYALGSRYPDVCLTLLKQAFSYTVYDNRQYMDIFDVRKAIENSKNIYPDVIKKELPNFDKMFNDIILEEKGEKPIEEWRKEVAPTRSELEEHNNSIIDNGDEGRKNKKQEEQDFSILSNKPEIVDRRDLKDGNPVQSIVSITGKRKVAKVGSVDVPKGLKEKISRADNVEELDDILLASDVGVIKQEKPSGPKIPTQYVVTDEIKEGVNDNYLLGRPIESTNDLIKEDVEENVDIYKLNNSKKSRKNEGKKMWNNGSSRPERQDISTQNFDKYNNYFHRDDDYSQNNEQYENKKRMDMLMGPTFSEPNGMNNQMDQNNGYDMQNNYGPNGPMDMQNNYGPMNGSMDMPNNYGPMNGPMNMPNNYGPMNGPMNMPNNYGPMNGPMNMPNNYGSMNGPMDMSNNYGPMNNQGNFNNENETLFGAPMYDTPKNNPYDNVPDIYGNANEVNSNPNYLPTNNQPQGFENTQLTGGPGETLFGAPMYSDVSGPETNAPIGNNSDMFGQLITNNMRIKNGKIVDEFPTFDKIDNLANIKSVISDVREVKNNNNANNQNNQGNQTFLNMSNDSNQPQPQPQEMNNDQNADHNAGKKWTFIDNSIGSNQPQENNSFLPTNNAPSQENTISSTANSAEPTNNKDYYEDMKSGNFVNFTELNNGKIKEEDANKYMGIQTQEDKPKYDLNLENNAQEDDNKFDDFFE